MVTKVMETAPPTRKLFIRLGSRNAAMYASVCGPAPKTIAMYLPRPRPMRLDRNDEAANRILAVNAVCACDGRSRPKARVQRERGGMAGWVVGRSATDVDSTGAAGGIRNCLCSFHCTEMKQPLPRNNSFLSGRVLILRIPQ